MTQSKNLSKAAALIAEVDERDPSILRLWFNRPDAKNSLNEELTGALHDILDRVRDDRNIRTIILRGKGGIFCAGADIKGFRSNLQGSKQGQKQSASHKEVAKEVAAGNRSFGDLMIKLNEQPQTVIMLVEGAAIGGGLGLTCIGDITIVAKQTRFRLSETSLGIPPAQIAPFVAERIGLTQARRLMLTGAKFTGADAVKFGIGHILAEDEGDLEQICQQVLAQIALCAPSANAITKAILFKAARSARPEALDFAADGFAQCMLGPEGREGVAAFLEKRKPYWATGNK